MLNDEHNKMIILYLSLYYDSRPAVWCRHVQQQLSKTGELVRTKCDKRQSADGCSLQDPISSSSIDRILV
jgi:hypothetical protein